MLSCLKPSRYLAMFSPVCTRCAALMGSALLLGLLVSCGGSSSGGGGGTEELTSPWAATATAVTWLDTHPFTSKHDGGWVYSNREDRLYAMYGEDNNGQTLYRVDPVGDTSEVETTFTYNRHGSQPVLDDAGTYLYQPPSESTSHLERYNTETNVLEDRATAPTKGTYSHGAWKNGKLWIVLDDDSLYSYDPVADTWSASLHTFSTMGNVAPSGSGSDLIYVLLDGGAFYSYDVTTTTLTALAAQPHGFNLGGNCQLAWFGERQGFIFANTGYISGGSYAPAIYDIANAAWHDLTDPKYPNSWAGQATYDANHRRLYVAGAGDTAWYYQF